MDSLADQAQLRKETLTLRIPQKKPPKTEKQRKNKRGGGRGGKKQNRNTRSVGHSYKKFKRVCNGNTTREEKEKGTEEIFEQ